MTIEDRLARAEQRIAELERRLGAAPPGGVTGPVMPHYNLRGSSPLAVCPNGCKPYSVCANVACPLRPVVTCSTGATP